MKCSRHELHVWRIDLDGEARTSAALRNALSQEERARAERFRTAELRERWMAAHGALRWILAQYVEHDPKALAFEHGLHGRPKLAEGMGRDIAFSLTHTGGLAMVAISSGVRVGIDAEAVRADIELEDLSRRFFSKEEAEEILSLPKSERLEAFYRCWSRKEALVKALGGGLSVGLDRFQVSVRCNEPARLMRSDGDFARVWSLLDVSEPGVAAAVAVEGEEPALQKMKFEVL